MKNTKQSKTVKLAWETINENKYEDELTERAEKAVRTKMLSARAKKAWKTRRLNSLGE